MKTLSIGTAWLFLRSSLVLSFVCLLAASTTAQKQVYIERNAPGWLAKVQHTAAAPPANEIEDGWYYNVFEKQDHAELKEHYTRCVREITSETGVQNGSQIRISFDPSYQKLVFHKLVIRRGNREIDQLQSSSFRVIQNEQELSRFIYSGEHTAVRILDDVRKGDRIDYSFSIRGDNPVFSGRVDEVMYFEGGSVISNLYYSMLADSRRKIGVKSYNKVPPVKKEAVGNMVRYSWQMKLTRTHKAEDNEPSWFDPYGRVQLSDYHSWAEVVNWGLALNAPDPVQPAIVKKKIEELKNAAAGNPTRYLELATRFVQDQVRYMGMEMGESSHRPNRPAKVLEQRYGDCKDKSLLLIELFRAGGVKAYPAYLSTNKLLETAGSLPSPGIFNHVVVVAEYQGRKIWIDPTISQQRGAFSDMPFPYTANVLVIRPGNTKLERVNAVNPGKTTSTLTFNLNDTTNKEPATLRVVTVYTGADADRFRADLAESNPAKLQETYEKFYREYYEGIQVRLPLEIDDKEEQNKITTVELYNLNDFWAKREPGKTIPHAYIYTDLTSGRLPELKDMKRKSVLSFPAPINQEQIIELYLPTSWPAVKVADSIVRNGYRFAVSANGDNDFFTIKYQYQTFDNAINHASFADYAADYKKISDYSNFWISWDDQEHSASFYNWNGESVETEQISDAMAVSYLIALFCALVFGGFLLWVYRRKRGYDLEKIEEARPIRGWLIIAAIGVIGGPIRLVVDLVKSGFLNEAAWGAISNNQALTIFLAGELIFNACAFAASIYIFVAFFNRRDILPRSMAIFQASLITFHIADLIIGSYLLKSTDIFADSDTNLGTFCGQVFVSILWIFYFINSSRVKETFVFPFDSSGWRTELLKKQMARPFLPAQPEVSQPEPLQEQTRPAEQEQV